MGFCLGARPPGSAARRGADRDGRTDRLDSPSALDAPGGPTTRPAWPGTAPGFRSWARTCAWRASRRRAERAPGHVRSDHPPGPATGSTTQADHRRSAATPEGARAPPRTQWRRRKPQQPWNPTRKGYRTWAPGSRCMPARPSLHATPPAGPTLAFEARKRKWTQFGNLRPGPKLADTGPDPFGLAQDRSTSFRIRPEASGRTRHCFYKLWAISAEVGHVWPGMEDFGAMFTKCWSEAAKFGANSPGRGSNKVGPEWARPRRDGQFRGLTGLAFPRILHTYTRTCTHRRRCS